MAGLGSRSTAGHVAFWLSKYSCARDALAKRFWSDSRSSVKWVFMPQLHSVGGFGGEVILRLSRKRSQDCASQPVSFDLLPRVGVNRFVEGTVRNRRPRYRGESMGQRRA